jgi:hypothetical protein
MFIKTLDVRMHILLDTDKDCDLLHDRPVLSTGRTPHDKQNRTCLVVMSPGGVQRQDGRTDGRTDWQTDRLADRPQVAKVTLTLYTKLGYKYFPNSHTFLPISYICLALMFTVANTYESVSKSFRTDLLERELQMVHHSATRCSCIAILWVSLMSFATITLCVVSQRVFVVLDFFIDSVRKLLDTLSYLHYYHYIYLWYVT